MRTTLFLILGILSVGRFSRAGVDHSGGGDTYAQEFTSTAYDVLQWASNHPIPEVDFESLSLIITKAKTHSTEENLTLDGNLVDAINRPDEVPPTILFNRFAWDKLKGDAFRRRQFVLHEFLGLLRVDDTGYKISASIDEAHVCTRSPNVKQYIEEYFHVSCDRILRADLAGIDGELTLAIDIPLLVGDFDDLTSLKSLTIISLQKELPANLFREMESLNTLTIIASDKQKDLPVLSALSLLKANQFVGLRSLKSLNLQGDSGYFHQDYVAGKSVFIPWQWGGNRIDNIEPGAFNGLDSLEFLDLSGNHITTLDKNAFAGMARLKNLRLSNHELRKVDAEAFVGLPKLETLDLKFGNSIPFASGGIHRTPVGYINKGQPGPWVGLSALKNLSISASAFEDFTIDRDSFSGLDSLQKLLLGSFDEYDDGQVIQRITPGAFVPLNHIEVLDLSMNLAQMQPPEINKDLFVGLENLRRFAWNVPVSARKNGKFPIDLLDRISSPTWVRLIVSKKYDALLKSFFEHYAHVIDLPHGESADYHEGYEWFGKGACPGCS